MSLGSRGAPRMERGPEVSREDQDSILGWAGRHPILSTLLTTAAVTGGLALGAHYQVFTKIGLPFLDKAGTWIIGVGWPWLTRQWNTLRGAVTGLFNRQPAGIPDSRRNPTPEEDQYRRENPLV